MGDNREESMDSRAFGLIDISHVEGKASFRLYPVNKMGKLK
jgi:signal peptidase I